LACIVYATSSRRIYIFYFFIAHCGELTLASSELPTPPLSHSPSSVGQRRKQKDESTEETGEYDHGHSHMVIVVSLYRYFSLTLFPIFQCGLFNCCSPLGRFICSIIVSLRAAGGPCSTAGASLPSLPSLVLVLTGLFLTLFSSLSCAVFCIFLHIFTPKLPLQPPVASTWAPAADTHTQTPSLRSRDTS